MLKRTVVYGFVAVLIFGFLWWVYHVRLESERNQRDPTGVEAAISGADRIVYSSHARCRMLCRYIDEEEVKDLVKNGHIIISKARNDKEGTSYPVEGISRDGQHVRIIVAPHGKELVIVTVIDLDTEWPCDCK